MASSIAPVTAGELDQRIQLQQRATGVDAAGQPSGGWVDAGSPLWAKVRPQAARMLVGADMRQAEGMIRVVIRRRTGVAAGMRLVWRGSPYAITSAETVAGGLEWVEILAKAVAAVPTP